MVENSVHLVGDVPNNTSKGACGSCRIVGAMVFYVSGGYMALEAIRNTTKSARIFYGVTSMLLGGMGSYRLMKETNSKQV